MDRATLLERYDREMRADPPESSGVRFERAPELVRELGTSATVIYSHLTSASAPAAIRGEAQRARELGVELEWKAYEHDPPPELPLLLERAGFRAEEPETLVVLDLADRPIPPSADESVRVVEVKNLTTFEDAVRVSAVASGPEGAATLKRFRDRLSDPTARLFVAYLGDLPVSAGRLELSPGRAFAGLWGGGTVPEHRHRGIYRALVRARVEVAQRRGYRFITVDALETSRPILERLGFLSLVRIHAWVRSPTGTPWP
ncbi:MAG: GNAT family N-acetyltransferase [Thermoplasmata archaeon]|nr:GNAT family N-acetyltransferase [Thermoplasmata archaeon]